MTADLSQLDILPQEDSHSRGTPRTRRRLDSIRQGETEARAQPHHESFGPSPSGDPHHGWLLPAVEDPAVPGRMLSSSRSPT